MSGVGLPNCPPSPVLRLLLQVDGRFPRAPDGAGGSESLSSNRVPPIIRDISAILTAPRGIDLVVIKVETSEPGLYGVGCATLTTRARVVASAVDDYLKPLLVGRDARNTEDIWQITYQNSYWRNSTVLNNALGGTDMALWDIKGKLAGLPVYQLLGGRARMASAVYRHADGREPADVEENVRRFMEEGYTHIRCQLGGYGGSAVPRPSPEGGLPGRYYDPDLYALSVPRLFEHLRAALGFEVNLLHDVHERLAPAEVARLAQRLDEYRLFFLEDPLAPEDNDWLPRLREASVTPIAMGELFTHPLEWKPLITQHLIDFIRVHISDIGGITPAVKLTHLCEAFGVRTAWHGPADASPIAHAANLHIEVSCHNFGIHEWAGFTEEEQDVFPGCPKVRRGYMYPNDEPGLGIDIDEEVAARFPLGQHVYSDWAQTRWPDGTAARP
jgi:mannonate dehydratase